MNHKFEHVGKTNVFVHITLSLDTLFWILGYHEYETLGPKLLRKQPLNISKESRPNKYPNSTFLHFFFCQLKTEEFQSCFATPSTFIMVYTATFALLHTLEAVALNAWLRFISPFCLFTAKMPTQPIPSFRPCICWANLEREI